MNPNDIATKQDINQLQEKLTQLLDAFEKSKLSAKVSQEETYLTSKEVSETYKISKSQLSDLRLERKIPYSKPFGVLIYPKSEIEKIIKKLTNTINPH